MLPIDQRKRKESFISHWSANLNKIIKDIAILGSGMVGMALAHQIKEKYPRLSISIIDKESKIGLHSSGRNSGILHAGIYYEPNTLKAKVCVDGAKRLKAWCKKKGLNILECGKVVSPQSTQLDSQLDILLKRGISNGAEVSLINEKEFHEKVPYGRTATGRALWSPNTCVVNPKEVLDQLTEQLQQQNVDFQLGNRINKIDVINKYLALATSKENGNKNLELHYDHLFNTTGLQADRVAKAFNVGQDLTILPFKGIYWQLHPDAPLEFATNLYPVPDLNIPFLGIHISPNPNGKTYLGPTAIPAYGRENYYGLDGIEPLMAIQFLGDISSQLLRNSDGFRRYAMEQALHGIKPLFLKSAQTLVPTLKSEHLVKSTKVGIRAQLYDRKSGKLIQDFLVREGFCSTHVLNVISPGFTASFALADLILKNSPLEQI